MNSLLSGLLAFLNSPAGQALETVALGKLVHMVHDATSTPPQPAPQPTTT